MKLGKRAPYDPSHPHRRVKLASLLPPDLPPLSPNPTTWSSRVSSWGLYQNDQIGDCGPTGCANILRNLTANTGSELDLAEDAVLKAYRDVGQWDGVPGSPSDQGVVVSDLLTYWQKTGIGGHQIDAFAEVEHADNEQIRRSIQLFGCVALGFELPTAAQRWGTTSPWPLIFSSQLSGDFAMGSWGGHFVAGVDADIGGVWIVTWAGKVWVPWQTVADYCDEAWSVFSCDFMQSNGLTPSGFSYDQMVADCNAMRDAA